MSLKLLWQKIQDVEPLIWWAYGFAILFIGGLIFLAQGCGLLPPVRETAETLNRTVQSIDSDGSGAISMQEIIQYCLLGWLGGRGAETAGKIGVKRIRNGRKRNDRSNPASGDA